MTYKLELFNKDPQLDLRSKEPAIKEVIEFISGGGKSGGSYKSVSNIKLVDIHEKYFTIEVDETSKDWHWVVGQRLANEHNMRSFCDPKNKEKMLEFKPRPESKIENREADKTEEHQPHNIKEINDKQEDAVNYSLNLILYGPPGTGKTYHTINYALAIIVGKSIESINNEKDRTKLLGRFKELKQKGQIEFITFHQSYSYEDFIQGIRPDVTNTGGLSFQREDGLFKKIADRALKNYQDNEEHNNYVIIIDEINRANISRVFGELITLIEKDKRYDGSNELSATLPSGESFTVPPNLYIIGTVNTADKSIALLDLALRRRFEFIKMYPAPSLVKDEKNRELLESLNKEILLEKGPDVQIGHSYFMTDKNNPFNLKDTMNNRVIPLLYEYFMNDGETVKEILKKAGIRTQKIMGLYEFEAYDG